MRHCEVRDMSIILRLDRVMADRKMSLNELSERVGISNVNLSNLKTGKVKAIRFSTLDAICDVLDCQPGDILEYQREGPGGIKKLPGLKGRQGHDLSEARRPAQARAMRKNFPQLLTPYSGKSFICQLSPSKLSRP